MAKPVPIPPKTDIGLEKLLTRISKTPTEKGCLLWLGGLTKPRKGLSYGSFFYNNHYYSAHRVLFAWMNDVDIPAHLCVRHKCDNPQCCNIDHLELGTHLDNMRDMKERGRHIVIKGKDHYLAKDPSRSVAPKGDAHYAKRDPSLIRKGDKLPGVIKITDCEVSLLKQDLAAGMQGKDIAIKYGISQAQVSAIKHGKYRNHVK